MPQHSYATQDGGFLPQFRSALLVAAGSNQNSDIGSPTETLSFGLKSLGRRGAVIRAVSRFYATPAVPAGSGPDFVNAAFRMELPGDAAAALEMLHAVEGEFGRVRNTRWGQRTLDLDLLACGQQVRPDRKTVTQWIELPAGRQMVIAPEELILPHPRLHERAFVLVPLLDIAPQWVHPVLGQTAHQLHDALPAEDRGAVKPLVIQHEHQ